MSLKAKYGNLTVAAFLMSLSQIDQNFAADANRCIHKTETENDWLFVNNCDRDVVLELCFEKTIDSAVNCSSVAQNNGDRLYPATVVEANSILRILNIGNRSEIKWGACYHNDKDDRNPGIPEGEWMFTYRCKNSNVDN